MDKETALHEFIKGFRIAFNNSSAYSRQHPYFIKSIEEFRKKVEVLFGFLSPVKLNITPEALFIDEKYWNKPLAYVELAKLLHQRKIKTIELKPGLNTEELADLLSILAMPPKEASKSGGLEVLLKKVQTVHISVEELDYSELLKMEGGGKDSDLWQYLFKGAISLNDTRKIEEAIGGFAESLNNINVKELAKNEELKQKLVDFFRYLKEHNKKGFLECSNIFFSYLVSSRNLLSQEEALSLKGIFNGFSENDFAGILSSELSRRERPDPLFLNLFSMFSQGASPDDPLAFIEHGEHKNLLKKDPLSVKRIQAFLANSDSQSVSPVYRNTLFSLLRNISYSEDFRFDPAELRVNYHFALLNMFNLKKDTEGIRLIASILDREWFFITEEKDFSYIRSLWQVIKDKQNKRAESPAVFEVLIGKISVFIEERIWDETSSEDLDYLTDSLERSRKGSQFYLDKIFQEDKLSVYGLKLFFKLFPAELDLFYSGLKDRNSDLEYMSGVVKIIANMKSALSLSILRRIFYESRELIKVEILKAMQSLPDFDREFMLGVLKERNKIIRKEALKALSRDSQSTKEALEFLLRIPSPWGSKNKLILENMSLIEECGLKESVDYLKSFTKMKLFWHVPLRNKALSILERL